MLVACSQAPQVAVQPLRVSRLLRQHQESPGLQAAAWVSSAACHLRWLFALHLLKGHWLLPLQALREPQLRQWTQTRLLGRLLSSPMATTPKSSGYQTPPSCSAARRRQTQHWQDPASSAMTGWVPHSLAQTLLKAPRCRCQDAWSPLLRHRSLPMQSSHLLTSPAACAAFRTTPPGGSGSSRNPSSGPTTRTARCWG